MRTLLLAVLAAAATWSPAQSVPTGGQFASNPHPIVEANGRQTIVWNEARAIRYVTRQAGGSFGSVQTMSDVEAGQGTATHLAAASTPGGDTVVVWGQRDDIAAPERVRYAIRPAGGDFGPVQTLSPGPAAGTTVLQLDVAVNARGDAAIAWAGEGTDASGSPFVRIFAASRPAGDAFRMPQLLSMRGINPHAGVAPDGSAVASWLIAQSPDMIQAAILPAGGTAFGPVRTLERGGALAEPFVAGGKGGELTVLWYRRSGRSHDLRYSVRRSGSSSFTAPVRLGSAPTRRYVLVGGANGDVAALWADTGQRKLLVRHRPPGRGFARAQTFSPATNVIGQPFAAIGPGGALSAIWPRRRTDGKLDLYAGAQSRDGHTERAVRLQEDFGFPGGIGAGAGDHALAVWLPRSRTIEVPPLRYADR